MKDEYAVKVERASLSAYKGQLESIPAADVVTVVRCDDCVYYGSRRWCELHSSVFDDNAFCSYGERERIMSYFPTDIPIMSDDELIKNGLKKPYKKPEIIKGTDLVPVVRCKDCKFRENDDFCTGRGFPYQLVPDDGFRDKGERTEE